MTAVQANKKVEQILAPHEICPDGTKAWMLCLGYLEADDAFLVRGANMSLKSTEGISFVNKRRKLPMYCVLIEHPMAGLLLYETGGGENWPEMTGPVNDVFNRVIYEKEHNLVNAIKSTGHDITDVKAVILGHLHTDHAAGLGYFKGSKVPVWCHEQELRSAFLCVATGMDDAVYLKDYLDLDLNWKVFNEKTLDFCQGIQLHHLPGHTEGLCGIQINLKNSGTWVFTSDHYHVRENFEQGITQGFLARDHVNWFRSHHLIKRIEQRLGAKVVMGHDDSVCQEVWSLYGKEPMT